MDSSSELECLVSLHTWPEPLCNPLVFLHSSVCSSWVSCSETRGLWKLRDLTLSSPLTSGLCTGVYAIAQAVLTDSRRSIGTCLSLFFLSNFPSFYLLCFQSFSFLISNFPLSPFVSLSVLPLKSSPWCPRFLYFYSLLILYHSFRLALFFSLALSVFSGLLSFFPSPLLLYRCYLLLMAEYV